MDKSRLVPLWFIYVVQNFLSVNEIIIFVARMNNAQRTRQIISKRETQVLTKSISTHLKTISQTQINSNQYNKQYEFQ